MKKTNSTLQIISRPKLMGCASLLAIFTAQQGAKAQEATSVPPISVTATPVGPLLDGSAAAGYRVKDSTTAGPIWGDLPVQDTPYSLTVVPSELIQNLNATNPEDIFKVVPQITNYIPDQNFFGDPTAFIRGYAINPFVNTATGMAYDGVQGGVGGRDGTTLEDKERVEVLSGVSGFLYGTGNVGGLINYVIKRPTATPYASVTLGDNAGANMSVHGDFGGPLNFPGIADGLFGYRINIAGQDGHTSIENQNVKHELLSGAFDIHLPYDILVQLNATHSSYQVDGVTPFYTSSLNPYPAPASPSSIKALPWSEYNEYEDTGGVKITWKPNEIFTLRAAYDYTREVTNTGLSSFNTILNYEGLLSESTLSYDAPFPIIIYTHGGYSFLDSKFSILGVQNTLTTGFTGFTRLNNYGATEINPNSYTFTTNFYNQSIFNDPGYTSSPYSSSYTAFNTFAKNYVLADEVKLNDQFTILAGANYTNLGVSDLSRSGAVTSGYGKGGLTPTVSLIYKPLPWLTGYATYQQSLQPGSVVTNGSLIYTNNGAILPPTRGTQYEVGVKATVAQNLLLTAAVFDIKEADVYTQQVAPNLYTVTQSGQDVHKGAELTATGKIIDNLTVYGGVTLLDPRITNNITSPSQNGSLTAGVSPFSEKLYVEYNIPHIAEASWLDGFTLTAGWRWASRYYADQPNTIYLPGYSVGDLGFRYTTKIYDHPFILRFNVNNVANTAYWAGTGFAGGFEGAPRTFLATAEVKW